MLSPAPPFPADPLSACRPDVAACLRCGYDRRGLLPRAPCPECGEPCAPERALIVRGRLVMATGWAGQVLEVLGVGLLAFGLVWALLLTDALPAGMSRLVGPLLWAPLFVLGLFLMRRSRRPEHSKAWCFTVGGIGSTVHNGAHVRTPWTRYRAPRAAGTCVALTTKVVWESTTYVQTSLPTETVAELARAADVLRTQALAVSGSTLPTDEVAPFRICRCCGACRLIDGTCECAVCRTPDPPDALIIAGRTSPTADRQLIRRRLQSVAVAGALGLAWLGFFLWVAKEPRFPGGLVIPGIFVLVIVGTATRSLFRAIRDRGAFRDGRWEITSETVECFDQNGRTAVPWARVRRVELAETAGEWTRLRAELAPGAVDVPDLWVRLGDERVDRDVKELRVRAGGLSARM